MQNDPQSNNPRGDEPRYNNRDSRDPNFGDRNYRDSNASDPNQSDPNYREQSYGAQSYDPNYQPPSYRDPNFGEQYYSNPASANPPERDPRTEENWRLNEESSEPLRWMQLENNGEDIANQWRLESPSSGPPPADWQPVEYQNTYEVNTGGRRNWVLPAFITVALLAVLGYIAFLGINSFSGEGIGGIAGLFSGLNNDETAVAIERVGDSPTVSSVLLSDTTTSTTAVEETVAPPPTEPAAEPTATLAPTVASLPATVTVDEATVTIQYGLNARSEPRVDPSTELYLLADGTQGYVTDQQTDAQGLNWTEMVVITGDNTGDRVWVSTEFVTITQQEIERDLAEGLGLVEPSADTPTSDAAKDAAQSALDSVADENSTEDANTVDSTATAAPTAATTGITATVAGEAGIVNARSTPEIADNIVAQIPVGSALPALARSEDNQWVQVQREDSSLVWLFAELVTLSEPITTLPLPGEAAAAQDVASEANVDATTAITATERVTAETATPATTAPTKPTTAPTETTPTAQNATPASTPQPAEGTIAMTPGEPVGDVVPDSPIFTNVAPEGPAAFVSSNLGATAHEQPSVAAEVAASLPSGTVLPAVALSEDGQWVQVDLPDGQLGWVLRRTVQITPDAVDLPASDDGAATGGQTTAASTVATTDGITVTTNSRVGVDVYAEPISNDKSITRLPTSTTLTAIGRTAARDWVRVELADGTQGWVYLSLLQSNTQEVQALPVVQ